MPQPFPQVFEPSFQQGGDGVLRTTESRSQFRQREAFQVTQANRLALIVGQFRQRCCQSHRLFVAHRSLAGTTGDRCDAAVVERLLIADGPFFCVDVSADGITNFSLMNFLQPGDELHLIVAVESVEVLECRQTGLLHEVG